MLTLSPSYAVGAISLTSADGGKIAVKGTAPFDVGLLPGGFVGVQGAVYEHSQASAAATWTINHNLNFKPSITLYTVGGVEFEADVTHASNNQAIVSLAVATAGFARCT